MLSLLARLSKAVSIEATGWLWCGARLIVVLEGSPHRRGYGGVWATANNACVFSTLFGTVQPGKHCENNVYGLCWFLFVVLILVLIWGNISICVTTPDLRL